MNFKPTKTKIIISIIPLVLFILMYFCIRVLGDNIFSQIITIIYIYIAAMPVGPILVKIGGIFVTSGTIGWLSPLSEVGIFSASILEGIIIYLIISIFSGTKGKIWILGGLIGLYYAFFVLNSVGTMYYPPIYIIVLGVVIGYIIDKLFSIIFKK